MSTEPGGSPPKKGTTGRWIALSAGAVVVVALLITGFVAPGFLLPGDEPAVPQGSPTGQRSEPRDDDGGTGDAPGGSGGANALAAEFVRALNSDERTATEDMRCELATEPDDVHKALDGKARITVESPDTGGSSTATVRLGGTLDGAEYTGVLSLRTAGQKWCVDSLTGFAG